MNTLCQAIHSRLASASYMVIIPAVNLCSLVYKLLCNTAMTILGSKVQWGYLQQKKQHTSIYVLNRKMSIL